MGLNGRSTVTDLELRYLGQSGSGLAVRVQDAGGKTHYLPKSAIEWDEHQAVPGEIMEFTVPISMAQEKGLI